MVISHAKIRYLALVKVLHHPAMPVIVQSYVSLNELVLFLLVLLNKVTPSEGQ